MKRLFRWTLAVLAGLVLLVVLGGGAGYLILRHNLPQTEGTLALPALSETVTVQRDTHGIPTIRAASLDDAYTALGFLHAQDRLWQMDFMRRTAAGRLSEVAGPFTLRVDKVMRVLDLHALAEAQLPELSAGTRAALNAYAAGVNAYLAREPILPLTFQVLAYTPEAWRPADSVAWIRLMALRLSGNWRQELRNARLAEALDTDQLAAWHGEEPPGPATIESWREAARGLPWADLATLLPRRLQPRSASNAWVLAGDRTASGAPILANDPHLGLSAPGQWYLVRIETPARTLVGATAPGVPFMILGRNRHLAWGLTTTHSDTQDLFIETLAPEDPGRYLTPSGSAPFETRQETIEVAFQSAPETLVVRRSRHGPVISDVLEDKVPGAAGPDKVLALAWTGLHPDDGSLDAIHAVNLAKSVPSALDSLDAVGSPQQNIHLADDQGNIAVAAPGRVPLRKAGDGLRPVPGDSGAYDWIGTLARSDLPRAVNPADGRIINANNRLVPPDYPHLLAARWPPPHRADRITRLLEEAGAGHDLSASRAIQLDAQGAAARVLLPTLLDRTTAASPRMASALALLRDWDGALDRDRPAPLIFTAWMDRLNRRLFADELGPAFAEARRPDPARLRRILTRHPTWCDDVTTEQRRETCPAQVQAALAGALAALGEAYGPDLESWRWGDSHRARLGHPALSRIPLLGGLFAVDVGTPGGDETINRGGIAYGEDGVTGYRHVHGPGLRALHDLGGPPASSLFMIADGQSGTPLSPHFGDLARTWRDGGYVKLVGETQEDTRRLRLTPGQP